MSIVWGIVTMEHYRNTSIIAVCRDYVKAEELATKLKDWHKSWATWPRAGGQNVLNDTVSEREEWKRQCPIQYTQLIGAADNFGIEELEFVE